MEPEKIAKLISNGRAKKGYTLENVADACGTSKQNIKRYETGNFVRPDHEVLNKIFEYLDLDMSALSFKLATEATSETDLAAKWKRLADHYKKLADKYAEIIAERGISLD
jgi:transcriptional regulator with XRE-family HTH domain